MALRKLTPPSPFPRSPSILPSLGRGARILSKEVCSRVDMTSRASPSTISNLSAAPAHLTALFLCNIRFPLFAHSTAIGFSSTASTVASVRLTICIASIATPQKRASTFSPRATCWQILNRSGPIRDEKKVLLRSTTHLIPYSICDVTSGDLCIPAMMANPSSPGDLSLPESTLDLTATTLIALFRFMIALPISSNSSVV
mmetsp:Transcript_8913/g.13387  ORF Transcript_8913/g.13387 Transcript_8913/m.13387 type:complete len:200 (-) Transcript_8913:1240-1839(-)